MERKLGFQQKTMLPVPKCDRKTPLTAEDAKKIELAKRTFRRRSKSACDLLTKPLPTTAFRSMNPALKKQFPLLKPVQSTTDLSKPTVGFRRKLLPIVEDKVPPKITVKRPATVTDPSCSKPKISKPAPYDYKARFQQLNERHLNVVETNKELKVKLSDYESTLQQLENLKTLYATLEDNYNCRNNQLVQLQQDFLQLTNEKNELEEVKNLYYLLKEQFLALEKDQKECKEERKMLVERLSEMTRDHEESVKLNLEFKTMLQAQEELRRAQHNQIQELKGTIRVFCRVRPQKQEELFKTLCNIRYPDDCTMEIVKSKESMKGISSKLQDSITDFNFDRVFPPQASQAEIFEELSQLVQSALDGYNVCVFAYGQTGSGKTYTMQGEPEKQEYLGMIPRTVDLIFDLIAKLEKLGWIYVVEASFLEIYNETIRDLLDPTNDQPHTIRYNEGKGTSVTNLTTHQVDSVCNLRQLMNAANKNRAVAVTNFNEHSSRSHAVTKLDIAGVNKETALSCVGSLSLVDLAGSESAKSSSSDRITETKNINKSLSTLGTVMAALHKREQHIPYRNSKLTYLLQSCLGGNSKTLMFVNIAPFEDCYQESMNALRFAGQVKEVKIAFKRNRTYV